MASNIPSRGSDNGSGRANLLDPTGGKAYGMAGKLKEKERNRVNFII